MLDVSYQDGGKTIEARARLSDGWVWRQRTHGYEEREVLYFRNGRLLRTHVQVTATPAWLGSRQRVFPQGARNENSTSNTLFRWKLRDGILSVTSRLPQSPVDLDAIQQIATITYPKNAIVRIEFNVDSIYELGRIKFPLRVWLTILEEHNPPANTVCEFDLLPFFPGGQVESNRSRH